MNQNDIEKFKRYLSEMLDGRENCTSVTIKIKGVHRMYTTVDDQNTPDANSVTEITFDPNEIDFDISCGMEVNLGDLLRGTKLEDIPDLDETKIRIIKKEE